MIDRDSGGQDEGPSYDRAAVEAQLGFKLAPPVVPHIIDRTESAGMRHNYDHLGDQWDSLGKGNTETLEVAADLLRNQVHQLLGSISVREHGLLVRLVGADVVEESELSERAVKGLSYRERREYLAGKVGQIDQPDVPEVLGYSMVKDRLETAIQTNLMGGYLTLAVDSFSKYSITRLSEDGGIAAVELAKFELTDRHMRRSISPFDFEEFWDAAAEGEAALKELDDRMDFEELEKVLEHGEDTEVTAVQLTAYRHIMAEFNRRLAILGGLGDLGLRSAVLNRNGLNELFPEEDPDYGTWDRE